MFLRAYLSENRLVRDLRNSALGTGLYVGVCLSLLVLIWLIVANRIPFLERFAWERNVAAAAAFALLALIPPVRFFRQPWRLLVSGLTGWAVLTLAYRGYCMYFSALADRRGAFHLFILGAVLYTIATTLAWIGTVIWNVRHHHVPQPRQHLTDVR